MSMPRCSKSDQEGLIPSDEVEDENEDGKGKSRKRRWTRLGSTVWGSDNMPLKIKFKNYLSSISRSDQEAAARKCADVCIHINTLSHSARRFLSVGLLSFKETPGL